MKLCFAAWLPACHRRCQFTITGWIAGLICRAIISWSAAAACCGDITPAHKSPLAANSTQSKKTRSTQNELLLCKKIVQNQTARNTSRCSSKTEISVLYFSLSLPSIQRSNKFISFYKQFNSGEIFRKIKMTTFLTEKVLYGFVGASWSNP